MRDRRTKVFFDGGCRPNPGAMETAVVIRGVADVHQALGFGTNNDAEWLAALHALELADWLGLRSIVLLGDSRFVVDHLRHATPPSAPRASAYGARYRLLAARFDTVAIRYIRRAQNLAGIALERHHGRL